MFSAVGPCYQNVESNQYPVMVKPVFDPSHLCIKAGMQENPYFRKVEAQHREVDSY